MIHFVLGEFMKDIKEIIAQNIIDLRKEHNLTQGELASKLNYSDNTVSRWEHAEITPSVETLEEIAKLFSVPVEDLLKENITKKLSEEKKIDLVKWVATTLLCVTLIWFVSAIAYFYVKTFVHADIWMIFMWAVPASLAMMLLINVRWKNRIFNFCFYSAILWTVITCIFLQFINYHIWLIYIVGIPAQVALVIWTFVRRK